MQSSPDRAGEVPSLAPWEKEGVEIQEKICGRACLFCSLLIIMQPKIYASGGKNYLTNDNHARFYPSSLAVAEQKLMALGAAMNYKILLKYDSHAVEVPSGEAAWREFATHANYDDLAQAILQAQYLFDNLYALGMVGKRDNQVKTD